jgi:hypothetical protein
MAGSALMGLCSLGVVIIGLVCSPRPLHRSLRTLALALSDAT